jgi:hypothetical protein
MEAEVSKEELDNFSLEDTFGVVTYLSIIRKYPELREEILELRRIKNKGFYATAIMIALISGLLGYGIAMASVVF